MTASYLAGGERIQMSPNTNADTSQKDMGLLNINLETGNQSIEKSASVVGLQSVEVSSHCFNGHGETGNNPRLLQSFVQI